MANPLYGQNKADDLLDAWKGIDPGYLDFCAGHQGNLTETAVAVTDAEADSAASSASVANVLAATLAPGAVNSYAHDGGAAGSVYLPDAIKGTHLAMEVTGDIDQTGATTIFARGAAVVSASSVDTTPVFAKQVVGIINGATASAIEMLGTLGTPTSIKLIYTAAAANTNFLGAGSIFHFFAPSDGEWLVKVWCIPETTGATGVFTTSAS
jgi:hypothetical protein